MPGSIAVSNLARLQSNYNLITPERKQEFPVLASPPRVPGASRLNPDTGKFCSK
jgi:hypothetical protein